MKKAIERPDADSALTSLANAALASSGHESDLFISECERARVEGDAW